MKKLIAICKESYEITGRGIVLELKHNEPGLNHGTILQSSKTKLKWELDSRIIFDHAADIQKAFENEPVNFMLIKFSDNTKREESRQKIKNKELENIYQYLIKPINHSEKPIDGEELIIIS